MRKHTHPPWSTHPQHSLYSAPCVFLSLVHLRRAACGPEVRDRLFLLLPVSQNFYLIHYEPLVEVALAVICNIVGAVYLFRQQTWPLFQCALWSCVLHFDLPFFPCDYSRRSFADFIQVIRSRQKAWSCLRGAFSKLGRRAQRDTGTTVLTLSSGHLWRSV